MPPGTRRVKEQASASSPVQDKFPTYRLPWEKLKGFLDSKFPEWKAYKHEKACQTWPLSPLEDLLTDQWFLRLQ